MTKVITGRKNRRHARSGGRTGNGYYFTGLNPTSDMPDFPWAILWDERGFGAMAKLTRRNGDESTGENP